MCSSVKTARARALASQTPPSSLYTKALSVLEVLLNLKSASVVFEQPMRFRGTAGVLHRPQVAPVACARRREGGGFYPRCLGAPVARCAGAGRPNQSFKRTRNGKALGPRSAVVNHAPRGPSASPPRSA